MATKTPTPSDPAFASALAQVQPALAAWRQGRQHREPIPAGLWSAMATVARVHGLSRVAQALGVNYTALQRHAVASGARPTAVAGPAAAGFVEVPMPAWSPATQWVLELADRGGTRLTVRLSAGDATAALALAQGLWGQQKWTQKFGPVAKLDFPGSAGHEKTAEL